MCGGGKVFGVPETRTGIGWSPSEERRNKDSLESAESRDKATDGDNDNFLVDYMSAVFQSCIFNYILDLSLICSFAGVAW